VLDEQDRTALVASVAAVGLPFPPKLRELLRHIGISPSAGDDAAAEVCGTYKGFFDIDAPFAIRPLVAYTLRPEFGIVAMRDIPRRHVLPALTGVLIPIRQGGSPRSPESERSMTKSGRRRREELLMGPISRLNHDCDDPCVEFVPTEPRLGYRQLAARTLRRVVKGEHITVRYSQDYFEDGNVACLCESCELKQRNGWASRSDQNRSRPGGEGRGRQTRAADTHALRETFGRRIFSYAPIEIHHAARVAGDYTRALAQLPSGSCVARHCQMRFVDHVAGTLCLGCREQVRALPTAASTLHRYYCSVARGRTVLAPLSSIAPVVAAEAFIRSVSIPGWRIYGKAIAFNIKAHKKTVVRSASATADGDQVARLASCEAAAAAGALQKGQIWLLVGKWREAGIDSVDKFCSEDLPGYMCVLLLRSSRVRRVPSCVRKQRHR
jgi:hypothetical protein